MADKAPKSPLHWMLDINSYWSLWERGKAIWDAMPPLEHVKAGAVCVISPLLVWAVSVWQDLPGVWVVAFVLLVFLIASFLMFARAAHRWSPATPADPPLPPKSTTPAASQKPAPVTPDRPISIRWVTEPHESALCVELTNETLGPVNRCGLRVKDLRPWAKGGFVKEDNEPRIAAIFGGETIKPLEPKIVPLVLDRDDHFTVRSVKNTLRGDRETVWSLTLEISTSAGSYESPELFFQWGPRLSIASDPRESAQ